MFDYKITQFSHQVASLTDQPNLTATELKAWFDSSPEELRQSLNAVCDDAQTLDAKVDGIVERTFAGAVSRDMLDSALQSELDDKAEIVDVTAEATARAAADTALSARIDQLIVAGTYTGDGQSSQFINLGFTPRAILTANADGRSSQGNILYGGLAITGSNASLVSITENGFSVSGTGGNNYGNSNGSTYKYVAVR